jgi:HK97 gp10 family phage protein
MPAKPFAIDVIGAPELKAVLAALEPKVAKKLTRQAMRKAQKIVLADAKRLVPVDTGQLKKSLSIRALKRSRSRFGVSVQTKEGLFKGEQFYGGFIELGTKKMQARPYLRPALYDNEARVREVFAGSLRELIRELPAKK